MPVLDALNLVKKQLKREDITDAQVIKEINNNSNNDTKKEAVSKMEQDIFEQPESLRRTMEGRVNFQEKSVYLEEIESYVADILRCRRLIVIGVGSSYNVAIGSRQILEELLDMPVFVELASDFLDRQVPVFRDDMCLFISQSGETSSVLQACEYCKKKDALTMHVTNNNTSSLTKLTDFGIDVRAGTEHGITSTKTYTSQFITMILVALQLAADKVPKQARIKAIISALELLPDQISEILHCKKIKSTCTKIRYENSLLVMGRGYQQASCLEGSLKLKEVVNVHSEGIHSGELKHGPLALIDGQIPIIMIIMRDAIYHKCLNALQQVKARDGKPIIICEKEDYETSQMAEHAIEVPKTIDCLASLLTVIPLQLVSLYLALLHDKDVDAPAGLVKTVIELSDSNLSKLY